MKIRMQYCIDAVPGPGHNKGTLQAARRVHLLPGQPSGSHYLTFNTAQCITSHGQLTHTTSTMPTKRKRWTQKKRKAPALPPTGGRMPRKQLALRSARASAPPTHRVSEDQEEEEWEEDEEDEEEEDKEQEQEETEEEQRGEEQGEDDDLPPLVMSRKGRRPTGESTDVVFSCMRTHTDLKMHYACYTAIKARKGDLSDDKEWEKELQERYQVSHTHTVWWNVARDVC
jgi:hypothetical protein